MTYKDFKKYNDKAKCYFDTLGRISDVNFTKGTCTLSFLDNITSGLTIQSIVDDILYNGMGAISNPSALRRWKGFS